MTGVGVILEDLKRAGNINNTAASGVSSEQSCTVTDIKRKWPVRGRKMSDKAKQSQLIREGSQRDVTLTVEERILQPSGCGSCVHMEPNIQIVSGNMMNVTTSPFLRVSLSCLFCLNW